MGKSYHVKHYINYQQEYEQLIDNFLEKTNLNQTNPLAYWILSIQKNIFKMHEKLQGV